ncbi:MAG: toll/interleukin-1 receptor domain-containing protein [Marinicaulis sp.]|nr:toll/interleukin-1 receptor domain-containing protein [Marinicaulis sp.]
MNVASRKYKAFISYSHADVSWARSLHVRLETFRTPKSLRGTQGSHGPVPEKLHPIFRDRDELSSGSALGPELQAALSASEFLIVLCSPASANSKYVNDEIRYFRSVHGDEKIIAAIVGGDPAAPVGKDEDGCFPPALIEPPEGSDAPREPIAADFREEGDGKRLGVQKLKSGMLGVPLDALVQREAARRARRMQQVAAGMTILALVLAGLTVEAFRQRGIAEEQRVIAERERDTATASLDYLVSIFEIANPATENPKTITALTILERGKDKIDTELAGRPQVQAKLLRTMGDVYKNLGELADAEIIFLRALELPAINKEDEFKARLALSIIFAEKGEFDKSDETISSIMADLETLEDMPFDTYPLKALALETRGVIKAYGEFDKPAAIELFNQAHRAYEKSIENREANLARIATRQGTLFSQMGDSENALLALGEARRRYESLYSENHISLAKSSLNLGLAHYQAGNNEIASEWIEKAISIYDNVVERSHPDVARAFLLQGQVENALGKFKNAQTALLSAVDSFKEAYGDTHEMIAVSLIYLAQYQAENGRTDDAFQSLDEAKRIYNELFPPDHANHGDLMVYRAIALKASGRVNDARASCARGLEIMEQAASGDQAWLNQNRSICDTI